MEPWSALEAEARIVRTPCSTGSMVWRVWGEGPPLVLLHGGAGSWLHWLRTIPAFRGTRTVIAADLPGLGDSADLPPDDAEGGVAIVAAGLNAFDTADLVGFSFGGYMAGMVAARRPVRSVTLVGSGGLGTVRGGARLERVRDKVGEARTEAHRTNLHRWMIADPARIDATAVAIQDHNSRRTRLDSRPLGGGGALLRTLPLVQAPVAGIWGEHDHSAGGDAARPRAALHAIRPEAPFHVVPDAGHWAAYEAPDAFTDALRTTLDQLQEARHEHA